MDAGLDAKAANQNNPIESVLTEVRGELNDEYQAPDWKDAMQMPITEKKTLHKLVYFKPKPALIT